MTGNEEERGGATLIELLESPVKEGADLIARWNAQLARAQAEPGFRDARLHRALGPGARFGLVAVVRWDGPADQRQAMANPEIRAAFPDARPSATYEVIDDIEARHGDAADPGVTMINAFELPPDRVDEFLEAWRPRARFASEFTGFVDYRMHRAIGAAAFPLVNVAHYASVEVWKELQVAPEFQARKAVNPPYATANPALFEVVAEF